MNVRVSMLIVEEEPSLFLVLDGEKPACYTGIVKQCFIVVLRPSR